MTASAYDAAMAWLNVARSALQCAAECEIAVSAEHFARYQLERDEVDAMVRDAELSMRVKTILRRVK